MTAPLRILVTGSRDWADYERVRVAIGAAAFEYGTAASDVVVVHGGARGADRCAADAAAELGVRAEPHVADWKRHGRRAGPYRNQQMVDAGAAVCLAFPMGVSVGTRDCVRRAELAGIPVRVHEPARPP